jgi:uncharacterized protein
LPTLIILAVLISLFLIFVGFYTNWLWFKSVNYTSVYTKQLKVRALLFFVFFLVMSGAVVLVGWWAYRTRPPFRSVSLEQQSLDRYRLALEPYRRGLLFAVAGFFGLFTALSAASQWRTFMLFWYRTPFHQTDPVFHIDIGFYTFVLPTLRLVLTIAMSVVLVCLLVAVVTQYIYGGIRLQTPGAERTSAAARTQLSILIGVFLLLKAVAYWLDRYALVNGKFWEVNGAGYTALNAVLPAKNILCAVAFIAAIMFFVNAFRSSWTLAWLSFGLVVVSSVVIGGIYPALVQQFTVTPSQSVKEQPYIQRNIDATRTAYGIADAKVPPAYNPTSAPSAKEVRNAKGTIQNVRLMDPARITDTFDQLQQIRGYYMFTDPLDIDRYTLNGNPQEDVVIAPRELNLDGIPATQQNWINQHTVYTHGFGLVAAYGDRATTDGQPVFVESNIPSTGLLTIDQPRIYFGEQAPSYSIVGGPPGSTPQELDYPDDSSTTGQRNYTYTGSGGVPIGSLFNQIVYAVKFQESNIILSDQVNSDSRILYVREPRQRIQEVAPWLTLDGDPYPAVVDGRIVWIVDGYTTSDSYPYSQQAQFGQVTADSLQLQSNTNVTQASTSLNYIRNSVKATVDAYDGTVTLYEWTPNGQPVDPILQTWEKAYPGTVKPYADISKTPGLMQHLRYPEDLFKAQRDIYSQYHVQDASAFYGGQDVWRVPDDPTATSPVPQPAYYLTLQMPKSLEATYSLTTTFSPSKRDTLAAFMAVNSNPLDPLYGTIEVLQLPRDTTIPGPSQMQNNFESDPKVSEQLSLLRKGGSTVDLGNLLTLPVGNSLLYVEPVYVRSSSTTGASYPLLRYVLTSFGSSVGFEPTFPGSLATVLGTTPGGSGQQQHHGTAQQRLVQAIIDANQAYADGQAALAKGDFAAYGQAQARLAAALKRAESAAQELGVTPPSTPGSGSTSPTPTPSGSTSSPTAAVRHGQGGRSPPDLVGASGLT